MKVDQSVPEAFIAHVHERDRVPVVIDDTEALADATCRLRAFHPDAIVVLSIDGESDNLTSSAFDPGHDSYAEYQAMNIPASGLCFIEDGCDLNYVNFARNMAIMDLKRFMPRLRAELKKNGRWVYPPHIVEMYARQDKQDVEGRKLMNSILGFAPELIFHCRPEAV